MRLFGLMERKIPLCAGVLLGAALFGGTVQAQEYPFRPIKLVVPFSPGGAVDILARIIGQRLAGDDAAALQTAVRLVTDAGFEPVVVGPLARAREFDAGTPVFGKELTAVELRMGLGLNP